MTEAERDPLSKVRSEWRQVLDEDVLWSLELGGSKDVAMFLRRVGDGNLRAIRSLDRGKVHLSISWMPHSERQARKGKLRYPTWDEIADARDVLLPEDKEFVMILPKAGEYVAVHATTFHLHEHP